MTTPDRAWIEDLDGGKGRIVVHAFQPPRAASPVDVVDGAPFAATLRALRVRPWSHQARALAELADGHDVVLATATASGKSLAYQVPVLEGMDCGRTALLLYPTKALAHDQLRALRESAARLGIDDADRRIVSYDGDTPRSARQERRDAASVVITNPDMLHAAVLPFHGDWASFLSRLHVVVVDELHVHRGLFGSHVANVLRRLARVSEAYGARPRYVATSATLRNPGSLFTSLTGRTARVVDDDGAPRGARDVVFWVPPSRPGTEVRRKSPVAEAADIAVALVEDGIKSLVFCNARRAAELLVRYARSRLPDGAHDRIDAYRAGYTAQERRSLERRFGEGDVTVLATTSAMELGVDVGSVDAVVLAGFPGSIMSYRQRIGRAGRRGSRSLAVLVPDDDPLSEHYLRHPDHLLGDEVEAAVADPFGPSVHPRHVVCAAAEIPIDPTESWLDRGLDLGEVDGLVERAGRYHARRRYPHGRVSLRGRGGERIELTEAGTGRTLGTVEIGRAVRECHTGSVYLHRGDAYLVAELNLSNRRAVMVPHIEDWYTQVRSETRIDVLTPDGRGDPRWHLELGLPAGVHVGPVRVVHEVHGFVRKRYRSEAILDEESLDLPDEAFETVACWLEMDDELPRSGDEPGLPGAPGERFASALHALEHTMIGLLPAFVVCERADVGGVSYPWHPDLSMPAIFVYDGAEGGAGYALAGASVIERWLAASVDRLRTCACRDGCPRCILSPKCGNGNQWLDKAAALDVGNARLRRLRASAPTRPSA